MKLSCNQIRKTFGNHHALNGATFEADFAHTLALIGPSGGGKSTLLRICAGLEIPEEGTVVLDGTQMIFEEKPMHRHRLRAGIVFQGFNLFPHLTALENVLLPLEKVHMVQDARSRANAALERFGLGAHSSKKPSQLSGGQRQRVAIARALAIEPDFLFMDEPTSALDPEMTSEVLDAIADLRDSKQPLILVTHEMGFARKAADVVAFVAEGKVLECGPSEDFFEAPRTAEAARFLQRILKY